MTLANQPTRLPTNKLTIGGGLGLIVGDLLSKALFSVFPELVGMELEVVGNVKNLISYATVLAIGYYVPDYANLPLALKGQTK